MHANQADFRKVRCTADHLLNLTSHVKKRSLKSTQPHFADVKKAYDSVWHAKLLYKLKNVSVTGMMCKYIKKLLFERCFCTRVGKIYSSYKNKYGYSTGLNYCTYLIYHSYTWPPSALSINKHVAQYAGDIATWVNTTLKAYESEGGKLCTKTRSGWGE